MTKAGWAYLIGQKIFIDGSTPAAGLLHAKTVNGEECLVSPNMI